MKTNGLWTLTLGLAIGLSGSATSAEPFTTEAVTSGYTASTSGGELSVGSINSLNTFVGELEDGLSRNFKSVFEFNMPDLSADYGNIRVLSGKVNLFVSSSTATQDIYWIQIPGDGEVSTADYARVPLARGKFLTAGAPVNRYISIDVTSLIQTAIEHGDAHFAIRLETATPAYGDTMFRANIKGADQYEETGPVSQRPVLEFAYEKSPQP